MPHTKKVTLSPQILSELELVMAETHENLEAIVNAAMAEYLRRWEKRQLREQQYEELAAMWNELAEDMADEKWLPVENEALSKFEKALD